MNGNDSYRSSRTAFALTAILLGASSAQAQDLTPSQSSSATATASTSSTPLATNTVVATVGPHRVVSLREALTLVAKQGPDVAAARAQAAIAEASVRRAWTAWQPDLTAQGTYDHTNAPQVFNFGQLAGAIAPVFGLTLTPAQTASLGSLTIVGADSEYGTLQLTQPLFTPQGLFLPGIAEHVAEAGRRSADEAREEILYSAASAYFALQGLEGLLQAAHDLESVALHREDEARAQIKAGTAVELQLLRAQSDTAEARLQIANLEGQRESLLPVLEALSGEAIQPLPAGSANNLPAPSTIDSEPWENVFAVKAAIEVVRGFEGQVRLDDFLWLPSIAGIAKGNYTSNPAFQAGKNYSVDLILAATIPLYDHGARYASQHEDGAKLQKAIAELAGTRAKARSNWIGARANLAGAKATLAQAEAQANVAVRAQAQVEASFKAGVATSLDLTDADNKRFTATSVLAQVRTVVDVRTAQLAVFEGHLYSSMVGDSKQ